MCVKSAKVSNSELLDNVPNCYQLVKRTCTALKVRICVNDSNLVYKLYIYISISLPFFFFLSRYNDCRYPEDSSK